MSLTIAVAGKGGTGKTTISGLLINYLSNLKKGNILAIDADPNSNLGMVLGVKVNTSIGDIIEDMKKKIDNLQDMPGKMNKVDYINYMLENIIEEKSNIDLLTMGRPEGPGCYCFINSTLRTGIDLLSKRYDFIVMDNEAGMEHLNRKITRNIDVLLIVSDSTIRGIRTAVQIYGLIKILELKISKTYLIINRVPENSNLEEIEKELSTSELKIAGYIPEDNLVTQYDLKGMPAVELPKESKILQASNKIFEKVLQS